MLIWVNTKENVKGKCMSKENAWGLFYINGGEYLRKRLNCKACQMKMPEG